MQFNSFLRLLVFCGIQGKLLGLQSKRVSTRQRQHFHELDHKNHIVLVKVRFNLRVKGLPFRFCISTCAIIDGSKNILTNTFRSSQAVLYMELSRED